MRSTAVAGLALLASLPLSSQAQTLEPARILVAADRTLDSLSSRLADSTTTTLRRQAPYPRSIISHEQHRTFLVSSGYRDKVLNWQDVRALKRILRADVVFDVIATQRGSQIELTVTRVADFDREPFVVRTLVASTESDAVDRFAKMILADAALTAPSSLRPPNE